MSSQIIYVKDKSEVRVSDKYVYHCSVYRIWKNGAGLMDDKYYVSRTPLNLKKIPSMIKKKGYTIQRYTELDCAPENYLINKGYIRKV